MSASRFSEEHISALRERLNNASLTIAMPAYNEEADIEHVVNEAFSVLKSLTNRYEVLVVNDCSTDTTGSLLDDLKTRFKQLRVIHHPTNRGIGTSNRHIYEAVRGDYLFWNAADNQIHMSELYGLLPASFESDIVVGNRHQRSDKLLRSTASRLFNFSIRKRFRLPIRDLDSVKVFRVSTLKALTITSQTAFIEVEVLLKARKQGYKLVNIDIEHHPRLHGTANGVNLRTLLPQLRECAEYALKIRSSLS